MRQEDLATTPMACSTVPFPLHVLNGNLDLVWMGNIIVGVGMKINVQVGSQSYKLQSKAMENIFPLD